MLIWTGSQVVSSPSPMLLMMQSTAVSLLHHTQQRTGRAGTLGQPSRRYSERLKVLTAGWIQGLFSQCMRFFARLENRLLIISFSSVTCCPKTSEPPFLWGIIVLTYFTDEDSEAQRRKTAHSRSLRSKMTGIHSSVFDFLGRTALQACSRLSSSLL